VNSDHKPRFSWNIVDGAASYVLQVNRIDGVQTVVIRMDNLTATELQSNDALAAGSYRVWVRAVSTTGELSPWSLEVNFSIAVASPPALLNKPRQGSDTVDDDLLQGERQIFVYRRKPGASALRLIESAATR